MPTSNIPTRRAALGLFITAALFAPTRNLWAQSGPSIKIYKERTCGCCASWAGHLQAAGFAVSIVEVADVDPIKTKLGVPYALASCHTAEIAGYVIEGHVPASVIKRLLAERPSAKGLAVAGMPIGSPGMEGGTPELYEVILFGPTGGRVYARCRGEQEV